MINAVPIIQNLIRWEYQDERILDEFRRLVDGKVLDYSQATAILDDIIETRRLFICYGQSMFLPGRALVNHH